MTETERITRLLEAVREGDEDSMDRLFEAVYDELKRRAHYQLAGSSTINTAALVVAVVAGAASTLWQAREAREQAARGAAVGDFLFSLFDGADPDQHPGEPVTALEILEAGVARVDSFAAGPQARVDLLTTLGVLFGKIGQYDRAEALLVQAADEGRAALEPDDPGLASALDALGTRLTLTGDTERAESVLTEALELRLAHGAPPLDVATTRGNLAAAQRILGRYDEAARSYQTAIAQIQEVSGTDSIHIASELMGLGQVYEFQDRFDEAEALYQTVRRVKEAGGTEDRLLAMVIHNLGVLHAAGGEPDEAVALHGEALAMWQRLFPDGHPEIARTYEATARVLAIQGEWARADSLYDRAADAWADQYGEGDAYLATIAANQANIRYRMGDFDAAAAAYRRGVAIWRAHDERRLLGVGLSNLGVIERERGDYASADTLLAEALEVRTALGGQVHTGVAETHAGIAGLRYRQGRLDEAERHARISVEQYDQLLDPGHPAGLGARLELGAALVDTDRCGEGEPLLQEVLAVYLDSLNPMDTRLGRIRLLLGVCAARAGDPARARDLLEAALPGLTQGLGPDAADVRRARAQLDRLSG